MTSFHQASMNAGTDLILGLAQVVYYLTDGNPAAAAIVGVDPQDYASSLQVDKKGDALRNAARDSRFPRLAARLATYAFDGAWPEGPGEAGDAISDFMVGVALLQGKNGPSLIGPDGTTQVADASVAVLQQLALALDARLAVDTGGLLTVPMLAALAGVAEKTIRMAAGPQSERPLKTTKQGASTFITADDALDWLSRRGDFKPSKYYSSGKRRPTFVSILGLATFLGGARTARGESIEAIARALDWDEATAQALAALESGRPPAAIEALQPQHLLQLAQRFDIPEPVEFARECYPLVVAAYGDALVREQLP